MSELSRVDAPKRVETERPSYSVDIYFAPHATAEHLTGIEERIQRADVFIPECLGWQDGSLRTLRLLSSGKLDKNIAIKGIPNGTFPDAAKKMIEAIADSGKAITLVDLTADDPLLAEFNVSDYNVDKGISLEENLERLRAKLRKRAESENQREEKMGATIPVAIKEVVKAYPELQSRKNIRVLMQLGSSHTRVYQLLKDRGVPAERTMPAAKYTVGDHKNEAIRRYQFGKEVGRDLALRVLVRNMFWDVFTNECVCGKDFKNVTGDLAKMVYFGRYVISQMSEEELLSLYDAYDTDNFFDFYLVFKEIIEAKNIDFPHSDVDLDKIIEKEGFVANPQ